MNDGTAMKICSAGCTAKVAPGLPSLAKGDLNRILCALDTRHYARKMNRIFEQGRIRLKDHYRTNYFASCPHQPTPQSLPYSIFLKSLSLTPLQKGEMEVERNIILFVFIEFLKVKCAKSTEIIDDAHFRSLLALVYG